MASDLEIRIGAELTEIKAALSGLQRDLRGVGDTAQRVGSSSASSLGSIESTLGSAGRAAKSLVLAIGALAGTAGLLQMARQGVEFNAAMEDARLGIASIITSMANVRDAGGNMVEGPDALRVSLKLAEDQLFKLRIAGLETAATTRELAEAFQQAIGPGLSAGLNLDQIRNITIQLTQAATALGVPTNQLSQEIRSILAAEIDINSRVAKTLGLSNEQVRSWQQQGKLAEELEKRMAGFSDAAKEAAKNFSVIKSNAKEALDGLYGDVFKGFFDELGKGILDATKGLFDTKTATIGDSIKSAADFARELARQLGQGVGNVLRGIVQLAKDFSVYVAANKDEIGKIVSGFVGIASAIGEVARLVAAVVVYFIDLGVKTGFWSGLLGEVAVAIAGIIGAIKIVATTFAQMTDMFLADATLMKEAFQAIFTDDTIADAIARRNRRVDASMKALKDTIAQVNAEYAKGQAAAASAGKAAMQSAAPGKAGDAPGSVDGSKNKGKLTDAEVKAQIEARDKLQKDAAKRELTVLEELYRDGVLAVRQYYERRQQIELDSINKSIATERERAKAGGAERTKALAEIKILEREKIDLQRKNLRAIADEQNALAVTSAEQAQRVDSAAGQRRAADLERLNAEQKIAIAKFYDERQAIELAALDKSIQIQRQKQQSSSAQDRAAALADEQALQQQRLAAIERFAAERIAAERQLADQITQARAQQLENQGRFEEAARLRLGLQYRDLLNRLKTEGNEAGVKLIDGLINTGAAKAQFDEIKRQFDAVVERLQQRQIAINAQRDTGAISGDTAAEQTVTARQQAIEQLAILNEKLQELAARSSDPTITQGALTAANALRQLGIDGAIGVEKAVITLRASLAQMRQAFAEATVNAGVDALTGFFTDIANGTKSAGDALKDFVRSFAQSMLQIAARALATFLVLKMLDAVYPGLGQAVAGTMSVGAKVNHAGGMAGTGPMRQVNPLIFAGAPRYHSGGMVGLKPGEVPAILQTGEEVLSRRDPRNQANGGGAGGGVRIINTIDPEMAGEFFNSPQGERVFVNLISRNAATLRNVLT